MKPLLYPVLFQAVFPTARVGGKAAGSLPLAVAAVCAHIRSLLPQVGSVQLWAGISWSEASRC